MRDTEDRAMNFCPTHDTFTSRLLFEDFIQKSSLPIKCVLVSIGIFYNVLELLSRVPTIFHRRIEDPLKTLMKIKTIEGFIVSLQNLYLSVLVENSK